jgi:Flp pilus assembly protein TadG
MKLSPVKRSPLRRFAKDKRGNVLMIMGFALIPITAAAGMTVDYTRAARLKTKLDAAADAAVLAAVSDASMAANDKTVCERAAALFDSQARTITDMQYTRATGLTLRVGTAASPSNVTYVGSSNTCSSPAGAASSAASRVVTLTYTVLSNNLFGGILDKPTIEVTGQAGSEVSIAPDINFYIALDTSPSMALPVTTTEINYLTSKANCAFACHSNKMQVNVYKQSWGESALNETPQDSAHWALNKESTTRTGTFGGSPVYYIDAANSFVYASSSGKKFCYDKAKYGNSSSGCASGKWLTDTNVYKSTGDLADTYWYAKNKGLTLRIDEMRKATRDLVDEAMLAASTNEATYQAAIYAFDYERLPRVIQPMTKIGEKPTSSTYAATVASGNAFKATAMSNNIDIAMLDDKTRNGCPMTSCTVGNEYLFTSFKGLFDGMLSSPSSYLPTTSGLGTRASSDTPQAFLFIITDGVSDEKASSVAGTYSLSSDRTRSELTGVMPSPGNTTHLAKCNAIKARGVQIAILYTEYTESSIASDEATQRDHVQGRINSASTRSNPQYYVEKRLSDCASPGFMLKVSVDGDISGALKALFRKAVAAPRLVR